MCLWVFFFFFFYFLSYVCHKNSVHLMGVLHFCLQKDFETAANLYKRATEIKESDSAYQGKELSTRSSSGETNSTVKNLLHS